MLKRLALLLSIFAAIGIGGAGVASAGNCTNIHVGPAFIQLNTFRLTASISSCTGVANIHYGVSSNGHPAITTETQNWSDDGGQWGSQPVNGSFYQPWSGSPTSVTYAMLGPPCTGVQQLTDSMFSYQIQSIDPKGGLSWGPWHDVGQNAWTWRSPC